MVQFYAYDSYDITSSIMDNGKREPPTATNLGCFIVYSKNWTAPPVGPTDSRNQLKYPSPPLDKTVITWCNYHVAIGGADTGPVLLASGTTQPLDWKEVLRRGYDVAN